MMCKIVIQLLFHCPVASQQLRAMHVAYLHLQQVQHPFLHATSNRLTVVDLGNVVQCGSYNPISVWSHAPEKEAQVVRHGFVSLRNVARPVIFHALTGCDTVSGFVRDGNNQNCISVQNLLLVLTDALLTLRSQNKACRPLRGCTHVRIYEHLHALM